MLFIPVNPKNKKGGSFFCRTGFCALLACFTVGCADMTGVPDETAAPLHLETAVDSDLLILKTDDIRVIEARDKKIAFEYNDRNVRLSQIGDYAKRFCERKSAHDTVLVNMVLTNRHNYRRAYFECRDIPVLIP